MSLLKKSSLVCLALSAIPSVVLATPPPPNYHVPDTGSSAVLLLISVAGFATFRRFFRR